MNIWQQESVAFIKIMNKNGVFEATKSGVIFILPLGFVSSVWLRYKPSKQTNKTLSFISIFNQATLVQ